MSDTAIIGAMTLQKTFKDGTLRFVVDVSPQYREFVGQMLLEPDVPVAIARISQQAAQETAQKQAQAIYGQEAKALRQSGFFRAPDVWRQIGSDSDYLEWVRNQRCACEGAGCGGDIVAAHVRRIADGAGVGIKPEYCAIPLCWRHHGEQHQKGESAIGAPDWWDMQRVKHVEAWAWATLKASLGYDHWNEVPPRVLYEWAVKNGVSMIVPSVYRVAA